MPEGTFSGEINVIDETPVIDPTQVNTGQVFDSSYMQNSAIGSVNRNYLTVVNQSAGVAGGGAWGGVPQPSVFGSTIGENAYFIDGVDTTDPTMATATVVHELRRHRRDPVPDRRVRGRVRTRHRRHPESGDEVRRQPILGHPRRPLPRRFVSGERRPLRHICIWTPRTSSTPPRSVGRSSATECGSSPRTSGSTTSSPRTDHPRLRTPRHRTIWRR